MKVNNINHYSIASSGLNFGSENKKDLLNLFHDKIRNSADMNDTVVVPRTIFKGYLGIMTGTTLLTLGGLLNKSSKISKILSVSGVLTSMYGTWAFVRPFIVKDK